MVLIEAFSSLLLFAILNATIGEQQIPVEVTTRLAPAEGTAEEIASGSSAAEAAAPAETSTPTTASPIPGIDIAAITAVAGVAGGAYAAFKKSADKSKDRDNAVADTTVKLSSSLKATDYGAKDMAMINAEYANTVTEALSSLEGLPAETKTKLQKSNHRVQENAKSWYQDVHEYYENLPTAPRPGELEGDKVKTKLAQVNKITEPKADL